MNRMVDVVVREGATRQCPECRGTLVLRHRHPTITVGAIFERMGAERVNRIRYEPAWVCQSPRCDHREVVGER